MKSIETAYRGYRFRSRTEARWAVLFDALAVQYQYEREGFSLGAAGAYLPDFWLPGAQAWVEIKGVHPSDEEIEKVSALADHTSRPTFLIWGDCDQPKIDGVTWALCCLPSERVTVGRRIGMCPDCGLPIMSPAFNLCGSQRHALCFLSANDDVTKRAYAVARSSRFEHGESPESIALSAGERADYERLKNGSAGLVKPPAEGVSPEANKEPTPVDESSPGDMWDILHFSTERAECSEFIREIEHYGLLLAPADDGNGLLLSGPVKKRNQWVRSFIVQHRSALNEMFAGPDIKPPARDKRDPIAALMLLDSIPLPTQWGDAVASASTGNPFDGLGGNP